MQVTFTTPEIAAILKTCFCDGGLELLRQSGITLDYDKAEYKAARAALTNPCLEDVFEQMLIEKRPLLFIDNENGGEQTILTLEKAAEHFKNPEVAEDLVQLHLQDDYDAIPCYRVLQHALYGSVIYG
jgi:hypothetical protein